MPSQRFFIGNLPAGTNEKEVRKAFNDYGEITSIELKEKENLVDPGTVKVLAFVTLNLFDGDVDFCLRKLNAKPINGEYVRVSVAKESFLERLKREREENANTSSKTANNGYTTPEKDAQHLNKSKRIFDDDNDEHHNAFKTKEPLNRSKKIFDIENDEDVVTTKNQFDDQEPIMITKKRASNSMQNGRIVIEATNNTPVHIIGQKKDVKRLSEKSFDSDKKRKESINKKKNQYQLNKSLIQKSLSSVDTSKTKIVFDNDEDDYVGTETNAKPLFAEDSDGEADSYANDFALKSEYEGSRGAALMKLKSSMNLDPRFKIDHKFVDGIEEEPVKNENSEREWQYGILEQVVGSKLSNVSCPKGHEKKRLKMIRYDPSKANQDEFLIKQSKVQPMDEEDESTVPLAIEAKKEVSKEVFYMVSDNLSNTLKTRGDGFSLLSMFGKAPEEDDKSADRQSKEKILISKNDKNTALHPFTYDSSESENEQDNPQKTDTNGEVNKGGKTQAKLFVESFFIPRNDVRLKEGKSFFRANPRSEKTDNYDAVKDKLKTIINTKINKSKRQLKGTMRKKTNRGR